MAKPLNFQETKSPSFFTEITNAISDIKFSSDGNSILARDYLSLKLWDIRNNSKPVVVANIHDHLKPKLCDLYDSDAIFDKFQCHMSKNMEYLLAGTYNGSAFIYDKANNTTSTISTMKKSVNEVNSSLGLAPTELDPNITSSPGKVSKSPKPKKKNKKDGSQELEDNVPINSEKKVLHCQWHPTDNLIALSLESSLYIYSANESKIL
eukprot:TRINITY_DN6503_c0_g1_i4.p1 TRINITY_DN6503_c0_g1~~TRINITY_DN6503_c0_g1_i4.p1  ORF type:complete len:208 (+),score=41.73 TRINITY_DN6503_c0_g1_i4:667-1290(+)